MKYLPKFPILRSRHGRRHPLTAILSLAVVAMTTRDIQEVVKELYGVDVSPTLVSQITADLDAEVTAWRQRPLDAVWPIVYLDGITVHVAVTMHACRDTRCMWRSA